MDPTPLSSDDIELWREADRVLDMLLDLPVEARRTALEDRTPPGPLRERVLALLRAADGSEQRFEGAALRFAAELPEPGAALKPGTRIGRWVLGEELGRGGMSVVFDAHDPLQPERRVAIKLLAGVLASGSGQRHLQREQQALSRLSHPLIVPLIEAGALADGTPWLAMARVDGQRIDAWCVEQGLDVASRVRLLVEVADAVAHAHRALVVHRDIKPANVLVDRDGKVRLLDFGIAGILDPGGERTRTLMQALTPDYAAPEQFADAPASTTIDVYGLGALLHRLLTGAAPARRSDADAPTALPSDCVEDGAFGGMVGSARARHTVRGDLDAILLKSLEHDPAHRYPGAGEFAADLRAWLEGRPVNAQRPTLGYRMGKFVRRHRGAVSIATIAVVAVLGALAVALWQSGRAADAARTAELRAGEAARESSRAEAVSAFMIEIFGTAAAGAPRDQLPSLQQLLDAAEQRMQDAFLDEPDTRARLLLALGEVQMSLGRLERADTMLGEATALIADDPQSSSLKVAHAESELARVRLRRGDLPSALSLSASALARLPPVADSEAGLSLQETIVGLRVSALSAAGKLEEAETLARDHWLSLRGLPAADARLVAGSAYTLANVLANTGRHEEALELLQLARQRSLTLDDAWELKVSITNSLAGALSARGRYAEALEARQTSLDMVTRGYPPGHVRIAQTRNNLASDLSLTGRIEEALPHFEAALAIMREALGDSHPSVAAAHNNRGRALVELDRYAEALEDYARAEAIMAPLVPANDRRLMTVRLSRADALVVLGRLGEAERLLGELDQASAQSDNEVQRAMREVVWSRLYAAKRNFSDAETRAMRAAEAALRAFPKGSGLAALALGHAADAMARQGRTDAALERIEQGNRQIVDIGGDIDRSAIRFIRERHALLQRLQRAEQAEAFLHADLSRLGAALPADDPRLRSIAALASAAAQG